MRKTKPILKYFLLALWSGLILACLAATKEEPAGPPSPPKARPESSVVKVTTKRDGEVTHFYVENNEYCEITMTFEMGLVNLKGSTPFPATMTFPARQVTEAFALQPIDPAAHWSFSYTNYFKLGSQCAQPDDSFRYHLPYGPGEKFKVTQGYNGKYSHKGSNQYAIDWKMPEGTPVHAARGGIVVRVKDDSDKGGGSMAYDKFNNYILIRHDDGTLGHYCHLQKGGSLVRAGQIVETGDIIAHSGNTGFSSGPHLHFCVFKTKNGRERLSIPVQFTTANDQTITLVEGRSYRAPEVQTASAQPAAAATAPASGLGQGAAGSE